MAHKWCINEDHSAFAQLLNIGDCDSTAKAQTP